MCWWPMGKPSWWFWLTRKPLMVCSPLGKFLFFSSWLIGELVLILLMRKFPQFHGEILFFTTLEGVAFMPWTLGGVLHDTWEKLCICNLLGFWLMVLTHDGAAFVISNLLRDVLNPFNSIGDALKVHVSSTQLRVFSSFLDEILNFPFAFLTF